MKKVIFSLLFLISSILLIAQSIEQKTNEKLAAKINANHVQLKFQRTVNYSIVGSAILIMGFLVFAFIKVRIIRKKNALLAEQNAEIKLQKEEIESERDALQTRMDLLLKNNQAEI